MVVDVTLTWFVGAFEDLNLVHRVDLQPCRYRVGSMVVPRQDVKL
jgi:hypothetical protein